MRFKNKKEIETKFNEILLERIKNNQYSENEYLVKILLGLNIEDDINPLIDDYDIIDAIYRIWNIEYDFKKGLKVSFDKQGQNNIHIQFNEDLYYTYYKFDEFTYDKEEDEED